MNFQERLSPLKHLHFILPLLAINSLLSAPALSAPQKAASKSAAKAQSELSKTAAKTSGGTVAPAGWKTFVTHDGRIHTFLPKDAVEQNLEKNANTDPRIYQFVASNVMYQISYGEHEDTLSDAEIKQALADSDRAFFQSLRNSFPLMTSTYNKDVQSNGYMGMEWKCKMGRETSPGKLRIYQGRNFSASFYVFPTLAGIKEEQFQPFFNGIVIDRPQ